VLLLRVLAPLGLKNGGGSAPMHRGDSSPNPQQKAADLNPTSALRLLILCHGRLARARARPGEAVKKIEIAGFDIMHFQ